MNMHVARLAKKFTENLRQEVGDGNMLQIAERNRDEKDPNICHSHDFCDANQVMIDSFELLYPNIPVDPSDGRQMRLFTAAWDMAKGFWQDALKRT